MMFENEPINKTFEGQKLESHLEDYFIQSRKQDLTVRSNMFPF